MAAIMSCFAILAIVVTLSIGIVISNDSDPIPADKSQLNKWFQNNVQPFSSRKSTLDPDLVQAEENQRVITVSQDGKGNFRTITDAVKSIPNNNNQRVIVAIAGGVYFEKVTIDANKPFVTFYGNANGMPTLVYNATTRTAHASVDSATLIVEGNYFVAANMIFKNSAPKPDPSTTDEQAVAVRAYSDKSAFYNSRFFGFQDTLLDDVGKHFYMNCYIEGTVDFVWGNGKSIFLNTELHVVEEITNVITCNSRDSPSQDSGYSFVQCSVTGTAGKKNTLLGRALHRYATVIYSYTDLSDVINPAGWSSSNMADGNDLTVFFREYKNTGPGSVGPRAPFVKDLTDAEARTFLTLSYIQGSQWLLPPPNM